MIYGSTLAGIAATVNTVDGWSDALGEHDLGIKLGDIPIESEDGETLLGTIVFDSDGHAGFEFESEWATEELDLNQF